MPLIDPAERNKQIATYRQLGWKILPLCPNKKTPLTSWKKKNLTEAKTQYLFDRNCLANVGILTGIASHLIVVDIDNHARAKEIMREVVDNPDSVFNTTCVTTARGIHLYYRMNDALTEIRSKRINEFCELKAAGSYVCAPPSIHPDGSQYRFVIPINKMQEFHEDAFFTEQERNINVPEKIDLKHLRYNGKNMDCISQLLNRDLQVGERDQGFFVLYHLLLKTRNEREFAKKIVYEKNRSSKFPMDERELNRFVFREKNIQYRVQGCEGKVALHRVYEMQFYKGQDKTNDNHRRILESHRQP